MIDDPTPSTQLRSSSSWQNLSHVNHIHSVVKNLLEFQSQKTTLRMKPENIAVITPYSDQKRAIVQRFSQEASLPNGNQDMPGVRVGSIDGFQGREAAVVIFDMTGNDLRQSPGFIQDARRLNVAITRVKEALFVIGHRARLYQLSQNMKGGRTRLFRAWVEEFQPAPEVRSFQQEGRIGGPGHKRSASDASMEKGLPFRPRPR
ncbi:hypothetical protein MMC19_003488 [Ptychographa xylographoides]|nr:hypothetical protein [Ptychographa xylographoides]